MRAALAVLAALQVGRLIVFMFDPGFVAGASVPTTGVRHACVAAYVRGAEMAADDPLRLYDPERYERGDSRIPGLAPHLSDLFQYPPTALLLPAAALGSDWDTIRLVWFFAQAMAFAAIAWWLAPDRWLLLGVAASFPVLMSFQFGQAHLITVAAAVLAWALFARGRDALGGAALAFAIGAKIFPGILVVPLLRQRRFQAIAWTALFLAAQAAAVYALFGPAPWSSFVHRQLPALVSGGAWLKYESEPAFVFSNLGMGALATKLAVLVPFSTGLAVAALNGLTVLVCLVLAWRLPAEKSALPLITLAACASTYHPAGYGMAPTLWLLSMQERPRPLVWAFLAVQPYFYSFPLLWKLPPVLAVAGIVAQGLVVWLAVRSQRV